MYIINIYIYIDIIVYIILYCIHTYCTVYIYIHIDIKQSKVHCDYIARTPLLFAPFLLYPSCPSLPSAFQDVFRGTLYLFRFSCKRCNNWQTLHLEKRVTKKYEKHHIYIYIIIYSVIVNSPRPPIQNLAFLGGGLPRKVAPTCV